MADEADAARSEEEMASDAARRRAAMEAGEVAAGTEEARNLARSPEMLAARISGDEPMEEPVVREYWKAPLSGRFSDRAAPGPGQQATMGDLNNAMARYQTQSVKPVYPMGLYELYNRLPPMEQEQARPLLQRWAERNIPNPEARMAAPWVEAMDAQSAAAKAIMEQQIPEDEDAYMERVRQEAESAAKGAGSLADRLR
jgi:hypothetical protein